MIENLLPIPLVIGLVEVVKKCFPWEIVTQFIPLVALIIGVLVQISLYGATVENVIMGLVVGLSAQGLYSGTKHTIEEARK